MRSCSGDCSRGLTRPSLMRRTRHALRPLPRAEQQSAGEVWARLRDPDSVVVFTVSPQSAASLAAHYGVSLPSAFLRITAFLRSAGARHVLDSAAAREVSLIESAVEFVDRCRDALRRASGAEAGPPAPTQLPLLASACPGWVCFAEKQHGGYILPHISAVKSPQAVMGTFVKGHLSQRMGYDPRRVHHVAVMPCYDKVRMNKAICAVTGATGPRRASPGLHK